MPKPKKIKLTVELVPSSSWQNNLRKILKPKMWDEIRRRVYEKNNNHCAICKTSGKLQAHEVWEYDDKNYTQKLSNIIPLCYLCHGVKHLGFYSLKKPLEAEKLIKHFMKINGVDRTTFQKHLVKEQKKFHERSKYEWQLNLDKLKDFE